LDNTQLDNKHLINEQIRASRIMLLDTDGNKLGEMSFREAMNKAQNSQLDLMQVGNAQDVAICKILNYESWVYHEQKKRHKQEFKNRSQEMKIMQFRPVIGDNDFNLKLKKVSEFLTEHHKVKIVIKFKNFRETTMHDLNKEFVNKIITGVEEIGSLEGRVTFGGREMNFILSPAKKPTPKVKP